MTQKVAVVAVHGVADQEPASSARAIADLLCTDPEYGSFHEVPLRVARERMDPGSEPPQDDPGMHYMYEQLRDYRDPAAEPDAVAVYDTVRLEGRGKSGQQVHVHEVYWADLSRAGETWYRLLAEFYQLILHLPSLGRNGLRYAAQANRNTRPWRVAHGVQRFAVWLLTVPAALINLIMLSVGLIALSGELPPQFHFPVAFVAGTVTLTAIPVAILGLAKARSLLWLLWIPLLLGSAATTYSVLTWHQQTREHLYEVLALEAALVAAGACLYVSYAYRVMKPKAWPFGIGAVLVMLGIALPLIHKTVRNEATAYESAIEIAAAIHPWVQLAWLLIFIVGVVAAIAGFVAVARTPAAGRAAAYRATWAARFSLGMPAALFAIFTLSIWYLVIELVTNMAEGANPPVNAAAITKMEELLASSAIGFEYFVVAVGVFVFAALFAAVPSIVAEIKHPRPSTDEESAQLGRWLTRGIRVVAIGAEVFTLPFIAMLLLVGGIMEVPERGAEALLALTAAGVALLITGKRFVKTFRAAVDVLLDIDNYMRESPVNATPRAQIAERFVSLLRHLCEWRDEDGKPYGQIIIVAHSQGTVISADVLRYLNRVPDKGLALINTDRIKLRLFTMGSPLRQIYAQAFPHLYAWITEKDSESPLLSPDPKRLTVTQWANVYCSGDYVGRNLWVAGEDRLYIRRRPTPEDREQPSFDFCAGAGAHTHYWDANATDVAAYLKQIVRA